MGTGDKDDDDEDDEADSEKIHVVNQPLRSFGSRYFGRSETSFSKGRRVVQPTYDDFYEQQGSSTNITNSFLGVVVAILTTNVSGKEIKPYY